ncbi:MAG TPA: phosphopantetheine-binding protein, partial [Candidatus Binatia bacterium]
RIESSEVEQKLHEHGAIAQAVVTGQPHPSGATRLVAYLMPRSNDRPAVAALREFLRDKLPEPMIPSIFVYLDALPLNPAGKVDRGALPVPGSQRPHLDTPFAPPNSEVEQELARVWAEVLGLDEVGVHDRFFDLGGQSLLATQIISRLIEKFKINIPIRALFEAPTVAQMAAMIDAKRDKSLEAGQLERLLAELESMSEAAAAERLADAPPDNNSHG